MPKQILGSQTDFSFGEIDVALKRNDQHPARKAGLRQMSNFRILNSGAIQNRSGRTALFPIAGGVIRIEEFTISPGNIFKIGFGPGIIQIISAAGNVVQTFNNQGNGAALPWASAANVASIVYINFNLSLYITFGHSMRPQVVTYDGVAAWVIADYVELVVASSQKRTPFYRISPQNVTLVPSATSGAIIASFSAPIVVPGMVGTRIRYAGRQILLGSVIDTFSMHATVIEPLPPAQTLTLSGAVGNFGIGDAVLGTSSGAEGIVVASPNSQSIRYSLPVTGVAPKIGDAVHGSTSGATGVVLAITGFGDTSLIVSLDTGTAFTSGEVIVGPGSSWSANLIGVSPTTMLVQLIPNGETVKFFTTNDAVAGPSANAVITAVTTASPQAISDWDDEVMNAFRGYPGSCFVDQFRLGFCDFPSVPNGICWSAINSPTDIYVDVSPDSSIFELAPSKVRVYYVVPGAESSEFVFCDTRIYYIAISATNPLKPGSVSFQILSGDGCAQVQPRLAQEAIVYANAGANSMMAVIAIGDYYRPFTTKDLSQFHGHLFDGITAIAVPSADATFNERYAYVLCTGGALVAGKYNLSDFVADVPKIGWGPWSGGGSVSWVSAWNADVIFSSVYAGVGVCEVLDDSQYLDCAMLVNAAPAPFAPPPGQGPLWYLAGQSVTLMDQGTRMMGTYQIDVSGNIVPQNNGGENLAIASLVAGQPWTGTAEPFAQDAQPGPNMHQRMVPRRISYFAAYVVDSTGFVLAKFFSGKLTPKSPALGDIVNIRRVPAWNMGDDATKPPPLRETVEEWRPAGYSFDPRVGIIKDTPGPLLIEEMAMEISI